LSKELFFHSRYRVEAAEEIIGIKRYSMSVLFFTERRIGLTKFLDKNTAYNYCKGVIDWTDWESRL